MLGMPRLNDKRILVNRRGCNDGVPGPLTSQARAKEGTICVPTAIDPDLDSLTPAYNHCIGLHLDRRDPKERESRSPVRRSRLPWQLPAAPASESGDRADRRAPQPVPPDGWLVRLRWQRPGRPWLAAAAAPAAREGAPLAHRCAPGAG